MALTKGMGRAQKPRPQGGASAKSGRVAPAKSRRAAPSKGRRAAPAKGGREHVGEIVARLEHSYPDAHCSLLHQNPLQLLIATILSAQCTDARVNMVAPHLFQRYPDVQALADADLEDVEEIIRSTGFYRNKARNIIGCAQQLVLRHGGQVPADLDQLVALPGIGRKTANVVLGNAFGIPGMVVDTHVGRLSRLLGLTSHQDPNKIELDLMQAVPREKWTQLAHLFIEHGRQVCKARTPRCAECVLSDLCPSSRA